MTITSYAPTIDPSIISRYGTIKISYLHLSNYTVSSTPPRIKKIARRAEQELRESIKDPRESETLRSWERLASEMGLSNSEDFPAPHALVDSILNGKTCPKINSVVDAANITALKFLTPVGAFDAEKLTPPIQLRIAADGESIIPIMGTCEVKCVPGEIVYADRHRIFSRYSRDADFSKITADTTNILCVVDGTPSISDVYLQEALAFLQSLLVETANPGWTCEEMGSAVVAAVGA
jgi:DNA/RNA-binding domain of Phe-tRNA-synthetase-like protein